MTPSFKHRQSCPPGACICGRAGLLDNPAADLRFLLLTRLEQKRLLERLENLDSLADLERLQQRMHEQRGHQARAAGVIQTVTPGGPVHLRSIATPVASLTQQFSPQRAVFRHAAADTGALAACSAISDVTRCAGSGRLTR